MYKLYRALAKLSAPFLTLFLNKRVTKGKEDFSRLQERFGETNIPRPNDPLIWFHAASVGESLSLLKLLEMMEQREPNITFLVTTGTVTSAQFMAKRLPPRAIHQYVPLDTPQWMSKFLNHWQPNLAVILESEIWPNMLMLLQERGVATILLNGGLSDKTYRHWKHIPKAAKSLFQTFHSCLTPSLLAMERYSDLGIKTVYQTANLKLTCDPLTYDHTQANTINKIIADRPLWVAASTHEGEEEIVFNVHESLKQSHLNLLTILAPRHPHRASNLLALAHKKGLTVAQMSRQELPTADKDIWLIDTLGDMGLIYSLTDIVFMGGTFVPLGGHNPIEAIQLNAVVLYGPYDKNFRDNYTILQPAMIKVHGENDLMTQVNNLLDSPEDRHARAQKGRDILQNQQYQLNSIIDHLLGALPS